MLWASLFPKRKSGPPESLIGMQVLRRQQTPANSLHEFAAGCFAGHSCQGRYRGRHGTNRNGLVWSDGPVGNPIQWLRQRARRQTTSVTRTKLRFERRWYKALKCLDQTQLETGVILSTKNIKRDWLQGVRICAYNCGRRIGFSAKLMTKAIFKFVGPEIKVRRQCIVVDRSATRGQKARGRKVCT